MKLIIENSKTNKEIFWTFTGDIKHPTQGTSSHKFIKVTYKTEDTLLVGYKTSGADASFWEKSFTVPTKDIFVKLDSLFDIDYSSDFNKTDYKNLKKFIESSSSDVVDNLNIAKSNIKKFIFELNKEIKEVFKDKCNVSNRVASNKTNAVYFKINHDVNYPYDGTFFIDFNISTYGNPDLEETVEDIQEYIVRAFEQKTGHPVSIEYTTPPWGGAGRPYFLVDISDFVK